MSTGRALSRAVALIAGGALLVVGAALLVLPGPGLLLVLAGLVVLSRQFPSVDRYVEPVRRRALGAAEDSVSSPLKLAGSVLTGAALLAAGLVWGLRPSLPFGGWASGTGLIVSSAVVFALLVWSWRRVRSATAGREDAGAAAVGDGAEPDGDGAEPRGDGADAEVGEAAEGGEAAESRGGVVLPFRPPSGGRRRAGCRAVPGADGTATREDDRRRGPGVRGS
ncbi:PGPGW domain-containing protein [Streptomyces tendae]